MKKDILVDIDLIQKGDTVFVLDVPLFLDDELREKLENSEAKVVYFNPIDYKKASLDFVQFIKYEAGAEEAICALLLNYFAKNCDEKVQNFIDELDVGYLSAESNIGEEELEELVALIESSQNCYMIIGDDFLTHKDKRNIIKMLCAINNYTPFCLVLKEKFKSLIQTIYEADEEFDEVEELVSYNGAVIYKNSKVADHLLIGGTSFSKFAKIEDGDKINIAICKEKSICKEFKIDDDLKGTIALCSANELEELHYNYKQVKITKV